MNRVGMSDSGARDELHRLLTSGVKVARLRVLRIECEHNRMLAEVARVNGRNLLVLRTTSGGFVGDHAWTRRGDGMGIFDLDAASDDTTTDVSNSCCARAFTAAWVRHELSTGRRKAVLRGNL